MKLPGEVTIRRGASVAMLLALGGCAALRGWQEPEPEPDAETGLAAGLAALEAQDYLEAHDRLTAVYSVYPDDPVGAKALLALAAMELDPRNPGRRLDVGAEIIGRYFMMDSVPRWQWPLLETTYLLALELGAAEYRVERAEVEAAAALEVAAEARADEVAAERAAASAEAATEAVRRTLPREKYYVPGSILQVTVDPTVPLAYGMPE
ncbi:MAG: hypothetical protein ACRELV_05640, partial [Longimicrobiales bacterium]